MIKIFRTPRSYITSGSRHGRPKGVDSFAASFFALLGACGSVGCDEPEAQQSSDNFEYRGRALREEPANQAGSRLTPTFLVGTDGSRSFHGWYDNELEEPCWFSRTSIIDSLGNRRRHCVPRTLVVENGRFFEDEGCKREVRVVRYFGCGDLESFRFVRIQDSECGENLEIYRVKEARTATQEDSLWQLWNDRCFEVSSQQRSNYFYITVDGSGDLDKFVAVSE